MEETSKANLLLIPDTSRSTSWSTVLLNKPIPIDKHFLLIDKSTFCPEPGDSGSPVFVLGENGQLKVAAIISAGSCKDDSLIISLLPEKSHPLDDYISKHKEDTDYIKTIVSTSGVTRYMEKWKIDNNKRQMADTFTISHPNGKTSLLKDWAHSANGTVNADKHTIRLPNGETKEFIGWSESAVGTIKAGKRTIKFNNGKTNIYENWSQNKNGLQMADRLTEISSDGTSKTYTSWVHD